MALGSGEVVVIVSVLRMANGMETLAVAPAVSVTMKFMLWL